MSLFKKAERTQLKARIALDGPSGSGKTYSALRAAFVFGPRVAVIDTEHGAAAKYAGESPDGFGWSFQTLELKDFNPERYTEAIIAAGLEKFDALVIDSLSHSWEGKGGALEMVDQSGDKNKYFAWGKVTPIYRRMFEAILASPCNVICTMRTKTEYEIQKNDRGQNVPVKIGTAPIIRSGAEYEFDVVADLDIEHNIKITKSRCSLMQDASCHKPGAPFWGPLYDWLNAGKAIQAVTEEQKKQIRELVGQLGLTPQVLATSLRSNFHVDTVEALNQQQASQCIDRLNARISQAA